MIGSSQPSVEQVQHHRLGARQARAAGHEDHRQAAPTCARRSGRSARVKRSVWPTCSSSCSQPVARPCGTRRMCSSIRSSCGALAIEKARVALDAGHLQHQVLAGLERSRLGGAQPEPADRRRQHAGLDQLGVEVLQRQELRIGVFVDLGLDHQVGLRRGAAGEDLAFVALEVHQREVGGLAVLALAFEHLHLAGAADAVAAGVRQPDAGAQAGVQHGLAVAGRRCPGRCGSIMIWKLMALVLAASAVRALDALEARHPEADRGLVDQAVVGQRLRRIGLRRACPNRATGPCLQSIFSKSGWLP